MSFLKINTSQEIETFLRILVEESVKASKDQLLQESDSEQDEYIKNIVKDKKRFDSISEQEEEEAEEEVVVADEEESEEEPEEEVTVNTEEETESSEEEGAVEANYFTIRDKINDIRSGNSLKATNVRQNLEQYVDRLDDEERIVLLTYLQSVSDIMHNEKTGSEAQDPSDDPVGLSTKSGSTEEEESVEVSSEEEIEDTSPPVKVGEKQKTESIRRRVLQLMHG